MKAFYKSPLYLGLATLVIAILVSTVKLSEGRSVTTSVSQANLKTSSLYLNFTAPDTVSLLLDSPVDIEGIDVTISYDPGQIYILPSTLNSRNFLTTGGQLDQNGEYSFTLFGAFTQVKSGIVAGFQIAPRQDGVSTDVMLEIDQSKSAVYSREGQINTLGVSRGVKFKI